MRYNTFSTAPKTDHHQRLSLEVEMDEGVGEILASPDKCGSTLLDVTVIKPKELEAFSSINTNTFKAEQVNKLIESMEKQKREKKKYIDELIERSLKYDDTIIKVSKHVREEQYPSSQYWRKAPVSNSGNKYSQSPGCSKNIKEFNDLVNITESVQPLFSKIRQSLQSVESKITNMQNINLVLNPNSAHQQKQQRTKNHNQGMADDQAASDNKRYKYMTTQQVYHTNATADAFNNLRTVLECQNKNRNTLNGPCLCQNCGIVGFLDECKRGPIRSTMPDSSGFEYSSNSNNHSNYNNNSKNRKSTSSSSEKVYLKELKEKVRILEERLEHQEELSVPKEYFRKIVTKIISYISPKWSSYFKMEDKRPSDDSMIPQDYSRNMSIDRSQQQRNNQRDNYCGRKLSTSFQYETKKMDDNTRRQFMKTSYECFMERNCSTRGFDNNNNKAYLRRCLETYNNNQNNNNNNNSSRQPKEDAWRWGEEIIRPGVDLKNKIAALLEEKLRNQIRPIKHNVITTGIITNISSDETFCCRNDKFEKNDNRSSMGLMESCTKTNSNKEVSVAYVNPRLTVWPKESHVTCDPRNCSQSPTTADTKHQQQDDDSQGASGDNNGDDDMGRREFINILSKTKESDKELLWKNIWSQAQANGQTMSDKVTIKIPNENPGDEIIETELFIKDIEALLLTKKDC